MGNSRHTTVKECATINDDGHKIVMPNKMTENVLEVKGDAWFSTFHLLNCHSSFGSSIRMVKNKVYGC